MSQPVMYGVTSLNPGLPEDKTKCIEEILYYIGNWPNNKQCGNNRGHGPGRVWCRLHDPAAVKARAKAKRDKFKRDQKNHRDQFEALQKVPKLKKQIESLKTKIGKLETKLTIEGCKMAKYRVDSERLSWVQEQARPNVGWVARQSRSGRGYRIHQSSHTLSHLDIRDAIDRARIKAEQDI